MLPIKILAINFNFNNLNQCEVNIFYVVTNRIILPISYREVLVKCILNICKYKIGGEFSISQPLDQILISIH